MATYNCHMKGHGCIENILWNLYALDSVVPYQPIYGYDEQAVLS